MYSLNSFSAHYTVPCKYWTHVCIDSARNTCAYSTSTMIHCSPCIFGCTVCAQWAGLCIRLLWNFASLISPGLVEHTVLLLWTIIIINIISKLQLIYSLIVPGGTHSSPFIIVHHSANETSISDFIAVSLCLLRLLSKTFICLQGLLIYCAWRAICVLFYHYKW